MKIASMEDLFVHELRELCSIEKQIIKALPKMAKAASSPNLRQAFQDHLEQTKSQLERLEQICDEFGISSGRVKSTAMEAILEEGSEIASAEGEPSVKDAALIGAAQCVEHFEIACYGTARTHAELLGRKNVRQLLQDILDEESETDEKLTELANSEINVEAAQHA